MTRLVIRRQRVTFNWSRLLHPVNDWPCSPLHHNDNTDWAA
jgi:hypothetical protein